MDTRHSELVEPFYLQMMRTNAAQYGAALAPAIGRAGRGYPAEEIIGLLRIAWREKVMGAWLSLLYDDADVTAEVLDALSRSFGDLDAPPLATAAVVLAGRGALGSLEKYATRDAEAGWGACGFCAAAIEHLGGTPTACAAEDQDRGNFADLLAVAEQLRAIGLAAP